MIYTYPANHGINTMTQSKKFCANMSPVYRSLHIPEGNYTVEDFIDYINNNSEYNYTRAGTDSLSYTQFLAKIVDNDIVIYTDDGTEFFINPICKMNTYKETNFASEHKLCSILQIKVNITQENTIRYNFDTISVSPSNYKEIFIENPWYLDTSEAPDFQNIWDVEKNTFKEFTVPEDTYSVNNYNLQVRLGNTSTITAKTINISNKSHLNLLKDYYNSIKSSAGDYIWTSSQLYSLKYYYLFHGYSVSNDSFASRWNGTPTRNNSILIPIMFNDDTVLRQGTFQEIPIVTNISITFDENNFSYNLPEHKIYGGNYSGLTGEFTVPAGTYTPLQYHECIMQVLPSDNTWRPTFDVDTMYQYPFTKISMKSLYTSYYYGGSGTNEHNTFNDLYGKLHLVYPSNSNYKIGHACNGPATNRCLSCTSGVWNVDDFVNYVNTTDEEKLFGCMSTTHEIFVTASLPFIINPVCSITKLGEADITPEGSTDYTFGTQKRILYHPMYKQIDCTVTYNGTTHTISGRYTPAELLREIKTLTNADIEVNKNADDEYNVEFPDGLTISDNPFFTSTENLSGLSRMDFTISVNPANFSYNDYIVNTTDITHEVLIQPTESILMVNFTADLPHGLQIDSSGNITGTINYSDLTEGIVNTTITVNGESEEGTTITRSFNLYINFMNIDYIENGSEYHVSENIIWQPTNVRGSITSASIVDCVSNLTVTMSDNYNLSINTGTSSGTYQFTVKLTDEKSQTATKVMTVNVLKRPSLNYNDKYYYSTGENVLIEPSYACSKDITWNYSNLPEGLSFVNGVISGKPKYSGDYNVTVTLIESLNNHECEYNSVSDTFTISITSFGYSQSEYTYTVNKYVSIIPAAGDYTYSLSGNLPCGLTFGSDGSITGVCDHPVISVLSITISSSDITKTVELTLNILPDNECKCNIYSRYYVDNELNKCEVVIDKGLCNDYEFTLNDNEFDGLVGPYMCILPPNHAVDLNIQTITDDNYETNNNNVNCYIKGFPRNEEYYFLQSLKIPFLEDIMVLYKLEMPIQMKLLNRLLNLI